MFVDLLLDSLTKEVLVTFIDGLWLEIKSYSR